MIAASLELERRLYESAVAAVEQTFAKEGVVATFLTSGAVVAFGSSLQAYATLAAKLDASSSFLGLVLFTLAVVLLAISFVQLASVLRGRKVDDIPDGQTFLNAMTDPKKRPTLPSREEVLLQLVGEYRQAREKHVDLVDHRMSKLLGALAWLGGSVACSVLAVFVAFSSVKGGIDATERTPPSSANIRASAGPPVSRRQVVAPETMKKGSGTMNEMKFNNSGQSGGTSRPSGPIQVPPSIGSTTMTKGGGR